MKADVLDHAPSRSAAGRAGRHHSAPGIQPGSGIQPCSQAVRRIPTVITAPCAPPSSEVSREAYTVKQLVLATLAAYPREAVRQHAPPAASAGTPPPAPSPATPRQGTRSRPPPMGLRGAPGCLWGRGLREQDAEEGRNPRQVALLQGLQRRRDVPCHIATAGPRWSSLNTARRGAGVGVTGRNSYESVQGESLQERRARRRPHTSSGAERALQC